MSVNPLGLPVIDIGRDVNGRFRPGNPGGPGNPFARKVASMRKAFLECVSEDELKQMVAVLKLKASTGDKVALRLILQYCLGTPEPVKDPDRMDIDEWDRLKQMSVPKEEYEQVTESIPACLASREAQTAWPCNLQESRLEHTVHRIHQRELGGEPPLPMPTAPEPPKTKKRTRPAKPIPSDDANPNVPSPPSAPTEPSRSSPTAQPRANDDERQSRASDDRRQPPVSPAHTGHSPAQPPSPNGETDEDCKRLIEHLKRLRREAGLPDLPPTG